MLVRKILYSMFPLESGRSTTNCESTTLTPGQILCAGHFLFNFFIVTHHHHPRLPHHRKGMYKGGSVGSDRATSLPSGWPADDCAYESFSASQREPLLPSHSSPATPEAAFPAAPHYLSLGERKHVEKEAWNITCKLKPATHDIQESQARGTAQFLSKADSSRATSPQLGVSESQTDARCVFNQNSKALQIFPSYSPLLHFSDVHFQYSLSVFQLFGSNYLW